MSNELSTGYNVPGSTLYVVVRRATDGKVWNVTSSAFETWADGSIGDYGTALTNQGGDLWLGNFPSSIAAGNYFISYYVQPDASPAIDDPLIRTDARSWNGAALADTSTVTLSQYALTTLSSLERYLRITASGNDTLLTEIINGVSARIERIAGRSFKARDYYEWANARNNDILPLTNYPVISVSRVAYGRADALAVSYSGSGLRATVQVNSDTIKLVTTSSVGVVTTTTIDLTDPSYATTSLVAAAINAVSGWSATVQKNVPSREIHPLPGVNAAAMVARLSYPDIDDIEYTLDATTGLVAFRWKPPFLTPLNNPNFYYAQPYVREYGQPGLMMRGHQGFLVQYRAGYETIPDDLALLANEIAAEAFNLGKRDTTTRSENLGDYGYTLADVVAISEGQIARIRNYGVSRIPIGTGIC